MKAKRILSVLLAALMCVSLMPVSVLADSETDAPDVFDVSGPVTPAEDDAPADVVEITQKAAPDADEPDAVEDVSDAPAADGDTDAYTVTFSAGDHYSVDVYYTQDYTAADETGVTTACARSGDTGEIDVSGDGQVNFRVVVDDGYVLAADPAVEGSYKNLKDQGDGIWRITKIAGDLTVTLAVTEAGEDDDGGDETVAPDVIVTSSENGYTYAVRGSSGAVITLTDGAVASVSANNSAVASVTYEGSAVTVTGVEGAAGLVTVSVTSTSGATYRLTVPVGYTTFVFEGGSVRVYDGESKYDVTGVDAAGGEYTPAGTANADGSVSYANTAEYSLVIETKKAGGTYVFAGSADDMAVAVKKEATGATTYYLAGLDLTSALTAPITVRKDSTGTVTIMALLGHTNTLTDAAYNNADDYADNAMAESAVIKAKDGSRVTIGGSGTLNLVCSSKNAIKSGENASLTISAVTLNVTSAKHGISCDNLSPPRRTASAPIPTPSTPRSAAAPTSRSPAARSRSTPAPTASSPPTTSPSPAARSPSPPARTRSTRAISSRSPAAHSTSTPPSTASSPTTT